MSAMEKSPCMCCEKRHVGCHVDCSEYNTWRIMKRDIQRDIADKRIIEGSIMRNATLYNYRPYNPSGRFRFGVR